MPHTRRARKDIADDLRTLARDSETLIEALAEDASTNVKEARERLREVVNRVKDNYGDWQERGMEKARNAYRSTDRTIRTHPYQSVGLALGAGLLLGWLLPSRD